MIKPTVVLITGHPATGKATLAQQLAEELGLPLVQKDQIKESLLESLGSGSDEWSRKLSGATWALLYQRIEMLLSANVPFITEANFNPKYANRKWQALKSKYAFGLIQICCETNAEVLLNRYIGRIKSGERHLGHVDASQDPAFLESIRQPFGMIDLIGSKLSIDTTDFSKVDYRKIAQSIKMMDPYTNYDHRRKTN